MTEAISLLQKTYDTPADLVRLILGLGVCAWLAYQLEALASSD
jgi:hypothetical protein